MCVCVCVCAGGRSSAKGRIGTKQLASRWEEKAERKEKLRLIKEMEKEMLAESKEKREVRAAEWQRLDWTGLD